MTFNKKPIPYLLVIKGDNNAVNIAEKNTTLLNNANCVFVNCNSDLIAVSNADTDNTQLYWTES